MEKLESHLTPSITAVRGLPDGVSSDRYHSLPMTLDATVLAPVAVALALPARMAARQNIAINNLHQLGIAMHVHHDAFKAFPARAICDKQEKPLLSWRVKLLPFLEQNALYQQFHLDEPWDSEHNLKLVDRMPAYFADLRIQTHEGT